MNPDAVNDYGVGICLTATGAVVAVVRPGPLRLAAVADVSTPAGLWQAEPGGPLATVARRTMARARRRLGLPRWSPVCVVCGPSVGDGRAAVAVTGRSATLLAPAGLVQARVVSVGELAALRRTDDIAIDAALAALTEDVEHRLAVAAGLHMLTAGGARDLAGAGTPGTAVDGDRRGNGRCDDGYGPPAGWAVERIGASGEPSARLATNSR